MQTNQTWADLARQILRQYNEGRHTHYACWGPHYVTYDQGEFYLLPFGGWAHQRYGFRCTPETVPWQEDTLWTFQVLP